jgi:MFS family permease
MNDHKALARKIVWTLFTAQCFGSAGFLASSTVNTIVGAKLTGQPALAGVPSAVYQVGVAVTAFIWGFGMERLGRRGGLTLGLLLGSVGAVIAAGAVMNSAFIIFLLGLVFMGAANSALNLARFAAAEVSLPEERGRAISNVVVGGAAGTFIWPFLSTTVGPLFQRFGIDELAWPYLVALVLLAISALITFLLLRPDPAEIGRALAAQATAEKTAIPALPTRTVWEIFRQPAAFVAMMSMVFGQAVMVMVMTITSLHMEDHNHSVPDISLVISSHVFGMYAFSLISGRLADRFSRGPVIMMGAATLILACLVAPLSPDVLPMSVALFLLGLGWNFCYVGGSSLLSDQLSPDERAHTQGFNDLLIGSVSALGSLGSGVVFAALGFSVMGLAGAVVALVPLTLVLWWQVTRPTTIATAQ